MTHFEPKQDDVTHVSDHESNSTRSSISILNRKSILNVVESDSDTDDHSQVKNQQIHTKQISESPKESHSGSYDCFYLFDDNNEPRIIDEKAKPITKHENNQNMSYSLSAEEEQSNCFHLLSGFQESDNELEIKPKTPYSMLVPSIKIPKTGQEYLRPIRPAFRLHLALIDDDGSITKQVIQHIKTRKTREGTTKQHNKHLIQTPKNEKSFVEMLKDTMENISNYFISEDRIYNYRVSTINYQESFKQTSTK